MHIKLNQRGDQGFSLLELLAVVAIISLLTIVTVPIYQNYVMKAQVGTMWHEAEAAKIAVTSDYYKFSTYANSTYAANSADFTTTNNSNISSISVASGIITITGASSAFPNKNISITWSPSISANNDLLWSCCYSVAAAAFISSDYCPGCTPF